MMPVTCPCCGESATIQSESAKVARLREALALGWEAMDSADFFRALSLNATTAALCQRAKEAMKVALAETAPTEPKP